MKNLFTDIPGHLPEELFETLVNTGSVKIQRIISRRHSTREGDWYDQDTNEFVILLKGAARLEFRDGRQTELGPGDCLQLPAQKTTGLPGLMRRLKLSDWRCITPSKSNIQVTGIRVEKGPVKTPQALRLAS